MKAEDLVFILMNYIQLVHIFLSTAAVAAGMRCVLVPSVPEEYLDLSVISKATLKLSSLEQFCPEHFGLPPYE